MLSKVEMLVDGEIVFSESVNAYSPDDRKAFIGALQMGLHNTVGAMVVAGSPQQTMELLAETAQRQIDRIKGGEYGG